MSVNDVPAHWKEGPCSNFADRRTEGRKREIPEKRLFGSLQRWNPPSKNWDILRHLHVQIYESWHLGTKPTVAMYSYKYKTSKETLWFMKRWNLKQNLFTGWGTCILCLKHGLYSHQLLKSEPKGLPNKTQCKQHGAFNKLLPTSQTQLDRRANGSDSWPLRRDLSQICTLFCL